jgi:Mg2+/Co2+ transporter CorB
MVPRNEITALDLNEDWDDIVDDLTTCQRTRLPVYRDDINNLIGVIHMRRVINLLSRNELTKENLESQIHDAYFIPEGTSLYQQLINFQKNKRRTALAVDEYGDIQGLVTLEDILEEVVGEFTTDSPVNQNNIIESADGSFLIAANTHIREINRSLNISLPTDGPKTLNGLILELLESIPATGTSLLIANHPVEVIKMQNNAVQMARLMPRLNTDNKETDSDG